MRRIGQLHEQRLGAGLFDRRRCRAQLAPPQVECVQRQSVRRAEFASALTGSFEPLDQFPPLRGGAPRPMSRTASRLMIPLSSGVVGSGE